MNIVLITSGFNGVAKEFQDFPCQPVGVIELHSNDLESGKAKLIRKAIALLQFKKSLNLQEHAAHHQLRYTAIFKRDVEGLQKTLADWDANLVITSYCPMVSMEAIKDLSHGAINLHPSLLPDYRGGNPLFWQVYDQIETTGVTVHYLRQTVDSGPIIGQLSTKRPIGVNKQQLTDATEGRLGTQLLKELIPQIEKGDCKIIEQPNRSNTRYAGNFRLKSFSKHVDLQKIDLNALHDLACYFGEWPADIGQYSGWRKLFVWKSTGVTQTSENALVENGTLQLESTQIKLLHKQGYVSLHPKFSIKHFIKVILSTLKSYK